MKKNKIPIKPVIENCKEFVTLQNKKKRKDVEMLAIFLYFNCYNRK